jgi:hypothetical protein
MVYKVLNGSVWLATLLSIGEILHWILSPEAGYPDTGFSWLSSVPTWKYWNTILK